MDPISDNSPRTPALPNGGIEQANVIDLITHDTRTGEVTLGMVERRPWGGSERRLFELQEKINAYLSFALDGEMSEAFPELAHQPLRLELICAAEPDAATLHF